MSTHESDVDLVLFTTPGVDARAALVAVAERLRAPGLKELNYVYSNSKLERICFHGFQIGFQSCKSM